MASRTGAQVPCDSYTAIRCVWQPGLGMYPSGPSVAEETADYMPPEASLGGTPFDASVPSTYDLWSVGIMLLECLLGTPRVLQPSPRMRALLMQRAQQAPAEVPQPVPPPPRVSSSHAYFFSCSNVSDGRPH